LFKQAGICPVIHPFP